MTATTTTEEDILFARDAVVRVAPHVLLRPVSGSRLHIASCYHLDREVTRLVVATASDRQTWTVYEWCAAELAGRGRLYYRTSKVRCRRTRHSRLAPTCESWHDAPSSTASGRRTAARTSLLASTGVSVAHFGKTYWVHAGDMVPLPGYDGGPDAATTSAIVPEARFCTRTTCSCR